MLFDSYSCIQTSSFYITLYYTAKVLNNSNQYQTNILVFRFTFVYFFNVKTKSDLSSTSFICHFYNSNI